ncbi:MAG TPA: penicillin-binding transpeptidase domain-containing protein [Thermoanaerobaculia bacterium]|nr:penicillin-binding transpeptidase domain-containing protein [Thermoanaerobaculia bacterium]
MAERRVDPKRLVTPLLFAVAIGLALLWWAIGIPLERGRSHLLAGEAARAVETLEEWARFGLRPESYEQLLAAAFLLAGESERAGPWLAKAAARGSDWFPALGKDEAGRLFLSRGLYGEFLQWDGAVKVRRDSAEARLYRAAAQLGAGRIEEARTTLASVDRGAVDAERLAALEVALARRREGSYPLVVDRNGQTIAAWQIANRDLVPLNTDFTPLVDRSGGRLTVEANLEALGTANVIETTLDPAVQRAALAALAPHRGSLVAIDPRTHEILAIASSPGGGEPLNVALAGMYEPGSIIKVLTALAAYDEGRGTEGLYPFDCGGTMAVEGRQFLDWARHGTVTGMEEAMAVSCNLAFARIGLELGREPLREVMSKARFGERVNLGILAAPLGTHLRAVDHDFMLANYAIGLEVQRVSTLHLAMLADMLANRGAMTTPRLVRARRSILGEPVGHPQPGFTNLVATPESVDRIRPALEAVVTDPRGTGRRAALPGVGIAMKTGTAGDAQDGYDSVVIAFAPADSPRIAVGIVAENAGPAELEGARIARDFLAAVLRVPTP